MTQSSIYFAVEAQECTPLRGVMTGVHRVNRAPLSSVSEMPKVKEDGWSFYYCFFPIFSRSSQVNKPVKNGRV